MQRTVITGASSGLGAEMARQLAARGHDLGLAARRTDRLDDLRAEILARHPGRRVEVATLDVTDAAAVRDTTADLRARLGGLDRFVVNAGLGKGAPLGTGKAYANAETLQTNLLGGLAQMEAAMEVFREQRHGHLVVIASVASLRGLQKSVTAYAASKAGLASLAEGLRMELAGRPDLDIDVTTINPGYIRSEMNDASGGGPLQTDTEPGVRAIVSAIEARKAVALVPPWPWRPLGAAMRVAPTALLRRMT